MNKKLMALNLQMYADGGNAAAAGGEVATPKAGAKVEIEYGKADVAPPVEEQAQSGVATGGTQEVDKKKAFKELIKNEYKAEHEEILKSQLGRRLREQTQMQEKLDSMQPLFDTMKMLYGSEDPKALLDAINEDQRIWQDIADQEGMSIDAVKRIKRNEFENKQLKSADEARIQQQQMQETMDNWYAEAERLGIDLDEELENQEFYKVMSAPGMSVETAYKVTHIDEIMQNTALEVGNAVKANTMANFKARGTRPPENGATEQPGVVRKDDVTKLTREDRENAVRASLQGKIVRW